MPFECADCKTCNPGLPIFCVPDTKKDGEACPSEPKKTCRGGDCTCAKPVNFRQVDAYDAGGGHLHFDYSWDSSTGHPEDLSACQVGELVRFPSEPTFTWPHPWVGTSGSPAGGQPSNGASQKMTDDHEVKDPPPIVPPYVAASFTVSQYYVYTCPCDTKPGTVRGLAGPITITRSVSPNPDKSWNACVRKVGFTSCTRLP
jgi:hypothetical protein